MPSDEEVYRNWLQGSGKPGFAKGGIVAGINPFHAYLAALTSFGELPQNPEMVNGQLPQEPELGPPMEPVGLASLVPPPPGALKPIPRGYARGGIVDSFMMSPRRRALLDAIAAKESPDYNVIYGGQRFSDYSQHPGVYVPIRSGPNKGKKSSAAGKYQFLESTWDDYAKKLNLKDFSPASQDRAAWELAKDTYGDNLDQVLASGDPNAIAGVGRALRGTWTSLPGGIEQGTTTNAFVQTYNNALAKAQGAAPPAQAIMAPGAQGEIRTAPTGQNYQYAQTTGMAGATGSQGWIPTSMTAADAAPVESGGISPLLMMMAMQKAAPPPPVTGGGIMTKRKPVDPEQLTMATSHTPNVYERMKRRSRHAR